MDGTYHGAISIAARAPSKTHVDQVVIIAERQLVRLNGVLLLQKSTEGYVVYETEGFRLYYDSVVGVKVEFQGTEASVAVRFMTGNNERPHLDFSFAKIDTLPNTHGIIGQFLHVTGTLKMENDVQTLTILNRTVEVVVRPLPMIAGGRQSGKCFKFFHSQALGLLEGTVASYVVAAPFSNAPMFNKFNGRVEHEDDPYMEEMRNIEVKRIKKIHSDMKRLLISGLVTEQETMAETRNSLIVQLASQNTDKEITIFQALSNEELIWQARVAQQSIAIN